MLRQPTEIERLYIDFDCFFASVEQQLQAHLRHRPVGVVPFISDKTCVIAPSREAKVYGIKTGMRIKEAKSLCPDIVFATARHDVYVKLHNKIYECIERCIHIDKACSIDEVVCTLMGREKQNLEPLAKKIRHELNKEIGEFITCSMGFAPNYLLAKTASDFDKPEGTVVWHPHQYQQALFTLKLNDIPGIGRSMNQRLLFANVKNVEQLYSLSLQTLRKIWNSIEGERIWYALHGYAIEPEETSRCMFGHSRILDPSNRNPRNARNCARLLTVKAARRLRRAKRTACCFGLSVRFEDKLKLFNEEHFPYASNDHTFLTALGNLWSQAMLTQQGDTNKYPYRIKQVSVLIYHLNKQEPLQQDLFTTNPITQKQEDKWNTLTELTDSIAKRYGNKAASLGVWEDPPNGYAGAKIAFGRIPKLSDF